ncbi:MAG TPA: gamma carbonic anhydrase family protein [Candidatus Lokiarchaeia archaeon]|nr:gamma carbonic anhydrase family protein [Candidatus Lokiarchaeia archaeon]
MTVYAFGTRIPKIDPSAWIHPAADVTGKVIIGPNVYVGSGAVLRGDFGTIIIGAGSAVEENVTIHARPSGKTIIEENVTIGHAAMLHNCTIHAGALIGMNATVSDYAEIGAGAIVAEGAVVKRKSVIAPQMIAAGIPATEIGPVPEMNAKIANEGASVYADLAKQYPKKLRALAPEEYLTAGSDDADATNE